MKRVLFGMFLAISALAAADPLREQINEMDDAMQIAMLHKDFAMMDRCMKAGLSRNFLYVDSGRKMGYAQMFAGMKAGLGMMQKVTNAKAKLLTLKVHGRTAVGTTSHNLSGLIMGTDKKTHVMAFTGVTMDSYVNQGGAWKLAKMEWKTQSSSLDGKRIDPAKMMQR